MRILIIKLGSIGDIVHTLPAAAAIRAALPQAELTWVVESRSAEILRDNPLLDELVEVDTRSLRGGMALDDALLNIAGQIKGLRKKKFDISIDFQGLLKSAFIGQMAGAKRRWGFSKENLREPPSRFLLTDTAQVSTRVNVVHKHLALASAAIGADLAEAALEFPIASSDGDRAEAAAIASQAGGSFGVLNPAGGWVTKLWPAANFGQLADRLWEEHGLVSVVVTGPKEDELAHQVAAASRSGETIFAQPSLKGFYELAKLARVYVGGDTGPTHLAIAAAAPVVGLFGPTEWWRNGSPREDDICVERTDIDCRIDCNRRKCGAWICFDFGVDKVLSAVAERLAKSAERAYS